MGYVFVYTKNNIFITCNQNNRIFAPERIINLIKIMAERKILNNAEAAKLLSVTEGSLRQMRHKHIIPYYKNKTGAKVYYLQSELEEWMLSTRIPSQDEVEEQALKETL